MVQSSGERIVYGSNEGFCGQAMAAQGSTERHGRFFEAGKRGPELDLGHIEKDVEKRYGRAGVVGSLVGEPEVTLWIILILGIVEVGVILK